MAAGLLLPIVGLAQSGNTAAPSAVAEPPLAATADMNVDVEPSGILVDALTCRTPNADLPGLLARLRRERPADFRQTERQYTTPRMDLYRLARPVRAWGHESDAVLLTDQRVLLAVDNPLEQAVGLLEQELEQTRAVPLSGALDDMHALVIYSGDQPGLENRVLLGCEYRIPGLLLLDDPADDWNLPTP
ncbi:hypothetical protein [Pseudoxanthomonas wuyuanensis]